VASRQILNLEGQADGFKFLIRERDAKFTAAFGAVVVGAHAGQGGGLDGADRRGQDILGGRAGTARGCGSRSRTSTPRRGRPGQDAEDTVQETMLAAWQNLSSFEGRASA
jgi:hypothetical protein